MFIELLIFGFLSPLGSWGMTDSPIIGVLTLEPFSIQKMFPTIKFHSFLAASYVKFLEGAGARVIPVWIGQKDEYYKYVVDYTNGLLLPGGAAYFTDSLGYADAGKLLYKYAVERNKYGDYYPIWGTCLGMELFIHLSLDGEEIRKHCSANGISLPLKFRRENIHLSKLFKNAPEAIIRTLYLKPITFNHHSFCFTPENFTKYKADEEWLVLADNFDKNGLKFISVIESKLYPFYGVQFHPEKSPYVFKRATKIPHSLEAVKVAQYFANFFVEETRKSDHRFPDWQTEQRALIYNYAPKFLGQMNGSTNTQLYLFRQRDVLGVF